MKDRAASYERGVEPYPQPIPLSPELRAAMQPLPKHPDASPSNMRHRSRTTATHQQHGAQRGRDPGVHEMSLWSNPGELSAETPELSAQRRASKGRSGRAASEAAVGSALTIYTNEVRPLRRLSREEERELGARATAGDEQAQHALVLGNLRLVMMAARRYRGSGLDVEDLIQEGNIGLLRATRSYDPNRDIPFANYAMWWIRNAIGIAIANQGRTIRLPAHVRTLTKHLKKAQSALWQQLGRDPTDAEIGDNVGLSADTVTMLHTAMLDPISIFDTSKDEKADLLEFIPDPHAEDVMEAVIRKQSQQALSKALSETLGRINPRLVTVLRLRHGLDPRGPLTLEAIGGILGVNRRRSHQLEHKAYRLLRTPANIRKLTGFLP